METRQWFLSMLGFLTIYQGRAVYIPFKKSQALSKFMARTCNERLCTECFLLHNKTVVYIGSKNTTKSGLGCQRWDRQKPHKHLAKVAVNFPDESMVIASNLCRDPLGVGEPWCYTVDSSVKSMACGVAACAINGGWSGWIPDGAGECIRYCSNPPPRNGGKQCFESESAMSATNITIIIVACSAFVISAVLSVYCRFRQMRRYASAKKDSQRQEDKRKDSSTVHRHKDVDHHPHSHHHHHKH